MCHSCMLGMQMLTPGGDPTISSNRRTTQQTLFSIDWVHRSPAPQCLQAHTRVHVCWALLLQQRPRSPRYTQQGHPSSGHIVCHAAPARRSTLLHLHIQCGGPHTRWCINNHCKLQTLSAAPHTPRLQHTQHVAPPTDILCPCCNQADTTLTTPASKQQLVEHVSRLQSRNFRLLVHGADYRDAYMYSHNSPTACSSPQH
jgi:hypothetical protein